MSKSLPQEDLFLGIDPGIATTGFGVIHVTGNKMKLIDVGVILTPAGMALPERLRMLAQDLRALIVKHTPTTMAVEELFFNTNVKSALIVGQARGAILLTAAQLNLPVYSYTPLAVKMAVCGYGRADKRQVQDMVKRLLSLPAIPKPDDAADAAAIAICHAHSYKLTQLK